MGAPGYLSCIQRSRFQCEADWIRFDTMDL